MAEAPTPEFEPARYRFRLLQYRPTHSGEFYNVAVVLEDAHGAVIDARFAPDFDRFACNPAADLRLLDELREEFEEKRLLGEAFSQHLERLTASRYPVFEQTQLEAFEGGEAPVELDRLVASYLATPASPQRAASASLGGREAIRRRMDEVFESHGLIADHGLVRRGLEAVYGPELEFCFDFGYAAAAGGMRYLQAFSDRNAVAEAGRLCFVVEHLHHSGRLTVVHSEAESDALALLRSGGIAVASLDGLDDLALEVLSDLGL